MEYFVKAGDTLSKIARANNFSLSELLELNPDIKNPDSIRVGQRIFLRPEKMSSVSVDVPLELPLTIAEHQLNPSNYQRFSHPILGDITVTGGFMEPHGHSRKSLLKAIFLDKSLKSLPPSNRNIGIDYVVADKKAIAWYSGLVIKQGVERGYGRRIHISLNRSFSYQGKEYPVYQAYAHLQEIWVKVGDMVKQGMQIGVMGGSSHTSDVAYPPHIDLSTWIIIDGQTVQINPQLLG